MLVFKRDVLVFIGEDKDGRANTIGWQWLYPSAVGGNLKSKSMAPRPRDKRVALTASNPAVRSRRQRRTKRGSCILSSWRDDLILIDPPVCRVGVRWRSGCVLSPPFLVPRRPSANSARTQATTHGNRGAKKTLQTSSPYRTNRRVP